MNKNIRNLIVVIIAGILLWFGLRMIDSKKSHVENTTIETQQFMQNDITTISSEQNNITNGQVSYTAQKVFFNKPTQEVTGSTNEITGKLVYDGTRLTGSANILTENLSTGNNMRDDDVRKLLGTEIATQIPEIEIPANGNYSLPIVVTINGVTQTLIFQTEITLNNSTIHLAGETDFNMSKFNITPPSVFEIYTVEDNITLAFDITGMLME